MNAIAFLFPGQGVKRAEGSLRAAVATEAGRAHCELAAREAGVPLQKVLERPSLLDRTEVLQPMLTAIALAAAEALADAGIHPRVVLGHSLGEVAAWSVAGCIDANDAVRLAALRGRLMAREAKGNPGGLVALATSDPGMIEAALGAGRRAGALCLAAHNAPDETVLSGDEAAVRAVMAFAPDLATRVPTSGAWHSPAMAGAVAEWRAALRETPRHPARCTFIANRSGEVVTQSDDLPDLLAEQLVRPVAWARALATASALAGSVVILGPGAVLRSLWHRNGGRTRPHALHSTEDSRSLAETIAALRALQ